MAILVYSCVPNVYLESSFELEKKNNTSFTLKRNMLFMTLKPGLHDTSVIRLTTQNHFLKIGYLVALVK